MFGMFLFGNKLAIPEKAANAQIPIDTPMAIKRAKNCNKIIIIVFFI